MPSFVLSLALLLLVVLTLLALSNRELIALTFLGLSTVALPLSVWIAGAIAAGFLLGLWILLLFRFGTVGAIAGSGKRAPFGEQRRTNYGPEDFAVVDDRFGEGGNEGQGHNDERYDDARERDVRYDDTRYDDARYHQDSRYQDARYQDDPYSDNRYDDVYGRGRSSGATGYDSANSDQGGYEQAPFEQAGYDRAGYSPANPSESDRTQFQDSFSAASGYGTERDVSERTAPSDLTQEAATEQAQTRADAETVTQAVSAAEPAVPADWDDPYREDWTEAELIAEPVLREESSTPKLKRWFTARAGQESSPSETGVERSESATRTVDGDAEPPAVLPAEGQDAAADWRQADRDRREAADRGDNSNSSNVYDADYRVVQPPQTPKPPEPRPVSRPQPEAKSEPDARDNASDRRDHASSEWDIESDLDW